MNKLASMSLDVLDHVINDELESLAKVVEPLSDQAKVAYVPSYEEQAEQADDDFALIMWHNNLGTFNKYAKYTSELVEINMAFLADKSDELPEELLKIAGANLTAAAHNYNLTVPSRLDPYKSTVYVPNTLSMDDINQIKYLSKVGEDAEHNAFALPETEQYAIDTPEQIKEASNYFDRYHNKLGMVDKLEFAFNLSKAASNVGGVSISKLATSYSQLNPEEMGENLLDHIEIRKSYLKEDSSLKQEYQDIQDNVQEWTLTKIAHALEDADIKADLVRKYGHGIQDPLHSVLSKTKIASILVDGESVTLDQLKGLSSADLTVLVGNSVIPELQGNDGLDVLKSLPKPIRQDILNLF